MKKKSIDLVDLKQVISTGEKTFYVKYGVIYMQDACGDTIKIGELSNCNSEKDA